MGWHVVNCEDFEMPFGKHKGKTLSVILDEDPCYLDWLRDADIRSDALRAAVDEMNEKYAAEIERAIGD
jgi:uncharacterized protein (DUF3820 family)